MNISYNWLKEYIDTDLPAEKVAEILTDTGLEVEKAVPFDTLPGGLRGVVVGHVLSVKPHPNADRLKCTSVDIGGEAPLSVVCGAPNVAEGQKVWVATVGTTLYPEGDKALKIKKSKIRGEVSEGMICAEDELGLGTDHDGIAVLPADAPTGTPAADYLGARTDTVFDIGLTPNRTDAFGHFGVARDLAARLNLTAPTVATRPDVAGFEPTNTPSPLTVEVLAEEACPRYAGIYLADLQIKPSPQWLQDRLRSIGISPKNNVVDVTNFVLHETGQPLHAFDADRIDGACIKVGKLPEGTLFKTLDGTERKLRRDDLMISDNSGGLCIAGVLGGEESGVSESTKNVFLESACFDPVSVRKTSKHHGIHTDASFRFERGVDPRDTLYALKRAALLIAETAGAEIRGPVVDIKTKMKPPVKVAFRPAHFAAHTGCNLSTDRLEKILLSLDFKIVERGESAYTLEVPTYRVDVTREADVVEEVLRIHGYNEVPLPERMAMSVGGFEKPAAGEVLHSLSEQLVGRGFLEAMSNGLTCSASIIEAVGDDISAGLVPVLNPLSLELDVLRPSLVISGLEAVAYNLNRQVERVMLFELGTAYKKGEAGYEETQTLALTLCGTRLAENWNNAPGDFDLSDMRGYVGSVFAGLGLPSPDFHPCRTPFMEGAKQVRLGGKSYGTIGKASAAARKVYGVKKDTWLAEIDLGACMAAVGHAKKRIEEVPRFPSVTRDLSLLLDRDTAFADIEKVANLKAGKLLQQVGLFDVYEGKNLPKNKKSYAVRFVLRDTSKTLVDKRVDKVMNAIRAELENALGAELR